MIAGDRCAEDTQLSPKTDTSAPIPTFASYRGTLLCERRNQRSTRKPMILVRFLNLKFLGDSRRHDRNFKFTALACASFPCVAGKVRSIVAWEQRRRR